MSTIQATIRNTETKGQLNSLRIKGEVPGIIYGGENPNDKISVSKKEVKNLINKDNFQSSVLNIKVGETEQKVLPREITFDPISDEPTHIDFLRIVKGAKIILDIPVRFVNHELSPGLKRGGVLNIVRRKVELKCPTETIPTELIIDLDGLDIGASIKISFIKLPENVNPTIQGRDFVIATVAAPTVVKEPEKPAEADAAEGETTEGGEAKATDATDEKSSETEKPKDEKAATEKK